MSEKDKKKRSFENLEAEETVEPIVGPVEIIGVNFRDAGKIYSFAPGNTKFTPGEKVIVETSRGVEMGTVKFGNKTVDGSEVKPPLKAVKRKATKEDLIHAEEKKQAEAEAAVIFKKKVQAHGLGMDLVNVEYTFDKAKLTFDFTCESRVDFRELVKDLASTFRTRIELHQIGIRDETKLMGGIGVCGRTYCCKGFLTDFVQVSIKMAKEQNFALNSSKASGACGRLMCCLRYEHDVYEEAIRVTPPNGSTVETQDGVGTVVEGRPLAAKVKVRTEDKGKESFKVYDIADIKVLKVPQKNNGKNQKKANSDPDEADEAVEN